VYIDGRRGNKQTIWV